jgi:hypothetical protein
MRPLDYPALKVAAIAVWRLRSLLGWRHWEFVATSRCDLCRGFFALLLDVSSIPFDGSGSRTVGLRQLLAAGSFHPWRRPLIY